MDCLHLCCSHMGACPKNSAIEKDKERPRIQTNERMCKTEENTESHYQRPIFVVHATFQLQFEYLTVYIQVFNNHLYIYKKSFLTHLSRHTNIYAVEELQATHQTENYVVILMLSI